MADEAKISKIVVDLGKKEIDLTTEQAEKLYAALHKMFGEKVVERVTYVGGGYYPYHPWRWLSSGTSYGCDLNTASGSSSLKSQYLSNTGTLCMSIK